jgi:hypothetical protein
VGFAVYTEKTGNGTSKDLGLGISDFRLEGLLGIMSGILFYSSGFILSDFEPHPRVRGSKSLSNNRLNRTDILKTDI